MVEESNSRYCRRNVLGLIAGGAGLTVGGIGNVAGQRTNRNKIAPNEISSKLVGGKEPVRGGDWSQQVELVADDRDENDYFGSSVAVSGDGTTAVIGAVGDDDPNGEDAGSTYVFENTGGEWTQQSKLTPDDGDTGDYFGGSVAVSGDGTTAILGAGGDENPNGEAAGSAYVFESAGGEWTQQVKLTPDDGGEEDSFGTVTLSGDGTTAIIGANGDDGPNGENAGSAYVFDSAGGEWTQQSKLAPDDGDAEDFFGRAVAVSRDGMTAIVGAFVDVNPNGEEAGSAYVFEGSDGEWSQQEKLRPEDGNNADSFGISVAISGDGLTTIIGANGDGFPSDFQAGSAYVFGTGQRPPATSTPTEGEDPTDGESDEDTGQSIPGFGLASALAGLAGAGYLRWRDAQ